MNCAVKLSETKMPDKKTKVRGNDPRFSQSKLRGDCRSVHVDGQEWQWKTNGYDIIIYSPTGKRSHVNAWTVEGKSKEEFDRIWAYRDWDDPSHTVYPGDVRAFIANGLKTSV
jgi:hypothetical protein